MIAWGKREQLLTVQAVAAPNLSSLKLCNFLNNIDQLQR
jgi:hypothetical protein